jgi:hypothetical protein
MLQKIAILSFMSLLAVTTIDQATRSLSRDIFEELTDIMVWAVNSLIHELPRAAILALNLKWTDIPIELESTVTPSISLLVSLRAIGAYLLLETNRRARLRRSSTKVPMLRRASKTEQRQQYSWRS